MKNILFVCTGNTCRSPMAEALLRKMAEEKGLDLEIRSAGVFAETGAAASAGAQKALQQRGIKMEHQAQLVTSKLINWSDIILTMTLGHKQQLLAQYPASMNKTFTLKEFVLSDENTEKLLERLNEIQAERIMKETLKEQGDKQWKELQEEEERLTQELTQRLAGWDVSDPFGMDDEVYEACAQELESLLKKLVQEIHTDQ